MLGHAYMIPAVGASGIAVALCTIPSLVSVVRQVLARQPRDGNLYEDADGKATPESVAAFSNKLPKAALLLFASAGTGCSLAAYLMTLATKDLTTTAWLFILLQAVAIAAIRSPPLAYHLSLYTFASALIQASVLVTAMASNADRLHRDDPMLLRVRVAEFVTVLALSAASVLLPRRPDVFYNGEAVDRYRSTSAYGRYTFSWSNALIALSLKKNNLDLEDLPRPDCNSRAKDVTAAWKAKGYNNHRLWLSILRFHGWAFALQWFLTLFSALLGFAPQWVMLHLLRLLENRIPGQPFDIGVWLWVMWLGLAIITQTLIESYMFWLSWAQISFPVRTLVSTLVFEKSMRRKDVKQARKKDNPSEGEGEAADTPTEPGVSAPGNAKKADGDDDDEDAVQKSKQGTVNLIGVDSKRVSEFCAYQNYFPGSLFTLVFSLIFLVGLLGWLPLLAGFTSMVVIMPFNIYFSKRYSAAQDSLMKLRDEKLGVITEALQGIRQIKFSALEPQWEDKIGEVRGRELKSIWNVFKYDAVLIACWINTPIALSVISIAVYAWLNGELSPSVAFVSLGVFRAMETTLSVVPELTTDLLDAAVSIRRIEEYLNSPDIEQVSQDGDAVSFDGANIAWPADETLADSERFVLRDVSLTFPPGELSIISGKTGTGKSLMLAAILGEVDVLAGTLTVPRGPSIEDRHDAKVTPANWILPKSIAYVAQIPWIENATIRENIIFGLPLDTKRYEKTIEACALAKDLEMLSDGEDTEIGANGINLSGGQKWRITLARAVYSRAGILVMDDIFSAVDAHVGRHIFEKCVNGELCAGRTRILVTHHVALCAPHTKFLVELAEGRVLHAGLLSELAEDGTLDAIKSNEQSAEEINEDETADATAVNSDNSSTDQALEADNEQDRAGSAALAKVSSRASQPSQPPPQEPKKARKFVEDEKREEGAVRRHVYATYLKASGSWWFWTIALVWFVAAQALNVGRSWWLRLWTGQYDDSGHTAPTSQSVSLFSQAYSYGGDQHQQLLWTGNTPATANATGPAATSYDTSYYISVYVGLSMLFALVSSLRYLYIYFGSIWASRTLFEKMNFIILRAPLRWLDTVPVGRILNRFTADFNIIDSQLANSMSFGGNSFVRLLGVVASGLFVSPFVVCISMVLLVICAYFGKVYITAARPAKRLESTVKSPVFEQFGTALAGVVTIRGFGKSQVYIDRMYRRLDDWLTTSWYQWLFNRWVGWRMSLVGSFFAVIVASIILTTKNMNSALAGFALSFALEFASAVMWTVRLYSNVELQMNAAERIIEYTELATEDLGGVSAPAAWPTEGRVEVNDLVVGYAADLPPVLKGLSFRVERNQRVGVVGRTGAGKSSLTLAFFRFLEARSGSIYIDGLDISKIKLSDLRSRLAIIPQDPVLFSGTIRSNLDPFDEHTDEELRDCLDRVHLTTSRLPSAVSSGHVTPVPGTASPSETVASQPQNTNVFNDLSSPISEGGLNLSQGQRQLLCLARAIVRHPRVMVLDEATSAVDMHTDALIQRSIREEFTNSTLLVIAHRLSTIADFDRILVLSDGAVAEFGTPRELWEKGPEEGVFRSMCDESGEREKLEKVVFDGGASSSA